MAIDKEDFKKNYIIPTAIIIGSIIIGIFFVFWLINILSTSFEHWIFGNNPISMILNDLKIRSSINAITAKTNVKDPICDWKSDWSILL